MKIPFDISEQVIHGGRNQALWVGSVISDIFGISSPIYLPWGVKKSFLPQYGDIEVVSDVEAEQTSVFGTPVIGTFSFDEGEYNSYDKDGRVVKVKMEKFMLPYSCIIEFGRDAVLTQTRTLGSTGSVKEMFGLDDWRINIKGIALNESGVKAHDIIDQLVKWRSVCDSIPVTGNLFTRKDIHNLVIENLSIQPVAAKYNVIPFEIGAISDEPIELIIS